MRTGTTTIGPKPYVSLFTRLAAVEVELHGMTRVVAGLKAVMMQCARTATNGAGEPSVC
jgi:hypothetical protein